MVRFSSRDYNLDEPAVIDFLVGLPNVANEPRAVTNQRRVGSIRVLGRPLYSTQFENCRFILLVESDDVVVTAPQ